MDEVLYWSLRFGLRHDVDPAILAVLTAVAGDTRPDPADLARIHPVPAWFLADWTRLLADEGPPLVGSPVRLSHRRSDGRPVLSIEYSQSEYDAAHGGYVFDLWLYWLAERPTGTERRVIGYHHPSPGSEQPELIFVEARGVVQDDILYPDASLRDRFEAGEEDDDDWQPWLAKLSRRE